MYHLGALVATKSNQMEISEKNFSLGVGTLWHECDLQRRTQWFNNGCVRILFAWQERLVVKLSIISAPMQYVRTAKRNGDSVQPKSRLIILGHVEPQIGICRTDALTTS